MKYGQLLTKLGLVYIASYAFFGGGVVLADSLQDEYRKEVLRLPKHGEYTVPLTEPSMAKVTYTIEFGEPIYKKPVMVQTYIHIAKKKNTFIEFFDRLRRFHPL